MEQGYLARESERVKSAARKTQIRLIIVFICLIAIIYLLGKDSIDFKEFSFGTVPFYLFILIVIMVISTIIGIFINTRPSMNGNNLILPFGENTKEAVGNIIDTEALEGKILVEEYISEFAEGKKPHGERIVLTPSYLLLCSNRVTAIPCNKIYWICAQVGHKGDSFRVKLLVFTENKIFNIIGVDIEHVKGIAEKLYKHIPNVFIEYEPSELSYKLEKLFKKNPGEFFNFYESEVKKNREFV